MDKRDNSYLLVDSGNGQKLERFGPYLLARPCAQALWIPERANWSGIDARFSREGAGGWSFFSKMPKSWTVEIAGLSMLVKPTDFGHVGLFPEQAALWHWMRGKRAGRVLNLFAYSGAATLAAASSGAQVTHVDASKGMVEWARDNARRGGLEGASIRWIVDDALKFLRREVRRGRSYDAIALDPPSFGRGPKGEVFKIERDLVLLLELCAQLLSETARYLILSCHTPGIGTLALQHLLSQALPKCGRIATGELLLEGADLALPSGCFARWEQGDG